MNTTTIIIVLLVLALVIAGIFIRYFWKLYKSSEQERVKYVLSLQILAVQTKYSIFPVDFPGSTKSEDVLHAIECNRSVLGDTKCDELLGGFVLALRKRMVRSAYDFLSKGQYIILFSELLCLHPLLEKAQLFINRSASTSSSKIHLLKDLKKITMKAWQKFSGSATGAQVGDLSEVYRKVKDAQLLGYLQDERGEAFKQLESVEFRAMEEMLAAQEESISKEDETPVNSAIVLIHKGYQSLLPVSKSAQRMYAERVLTLFTAGLVIDSDKTEERFSIIRKEAQKILETTPGLSQKHVSA